jgi:hypothetical protein
MLKNIILINTTNIRLLILNIIILILKSNLTKYLKIFFYFNQREREKNRKNPPPKWPFQNL